MIFNKLYFFNTSKLYLKPYFNYVKNILYTPNYKIKAK